MEMQQNITPNLRGLKFLFFAMILLLLGGALFLFVIIYERNQGKISTPVCEESLDVTLDGKVKKLLKEGNTFVLLTENSKEEQAITTIDGCQGKVLNKITIRHK